MAIRKTTTDTFQIRANDGSTVTEHFHDVEHNGVITRFMSDGAAELFMDFKNLSFQLGKGYRSV